MRSVCESVYASIRTAPLLSANKHPNDALSTRMFFEGNVKGNLSPPR